MKCCRPKVQDLVFSLYPRPLHPELFEIATARRLDCADQTLVVWITPTGHVLTWQGAGRFLCEVTASAESELPHNRRLLQSRFRGEQVSDIWCGPEVHYQVSYQVETVAPDVFLHIHDEILADGRRRGLLHTFGQTDRLQVSPVGFVVMEVRPGTALVQTFHTFPEEFSLVKTQTLIEFRAH